MIGFFCLLYDVGLLIGRSIKNTLRDIDGKINHKIDDEHYCVEGTIKNKNNGHLVGIVGNCKYKDYKTNKYYRRSLTSFDIQREDENKERAIQKKNKSYIVSGCRLPANVVGIPYKVINSDRLYVLREIKTKTGSSKPIFPLKHFLISVNPDNYGQVERFLSGKIIDGEYKKAFDNIVIDINKSFDQNRDFRFISCNW